MIPTVATILLLAALPAAAQTARPGGASRPAGAPAPAPAAAPAAAPPAAAPPATMPQQTTASFGDWVLRCSRPPNAARVCELVQGVQKDDRTVAEVAIGRPGPAMPLQMTLLVPPFVSLLSAPALMGGDATVVPLPWNKCLPGGCVAASQLSDEQLNRLRANSEPMRVMLNDGNARPVALPFSAKGLVQALEALAKEEAG